MNRDVMMMHLDLLALALALKYRTHAHGTLRATNAFREEVQSWVHGRFSR